MTDATVYRFHNHVAIHLPGMEGTCYLTPDEASALAHAVQEAAGDVLSGVPFAKSTLPTLAVHLANGGNRHAADK